MGYYRVTGYFFRNCHGLLKIFTDYLVENFHGLQKYVTGYFLYFLFPRKVDSTYFDFDVS